MAVHHATVRFGAAVPTERFATAISANDRYLIDQVGDPWMAKGDAGWEMATGLTPAERDQYLEDRSAKGFNCILLEMVDNAFGTFEPNNHNGDAPFTGVAFQSSLGTAYWDWVETIITKAETEGITVIAFPAYVGINSAEGWTDEVTAASNAQMETYGAAIGARFKDYPNIIWAYGGDFNMTVTYDARFGALNTGLASAGDTHLRTYHSGPGSSSADVANSETWLDIDAVYEYGQADDQLATSPNGSWTNSPTRPSLFIEGRYEFENSVDRQGLRRQIYTPVFAGCLGGWIWGNAPIWHFNGLGLGPGGASYDTWQESLDSPSTADVEVAIAFFNSLTDWHLLTPDTTDTFLTAGESTVQNIAAAAFSTSQGFVYVPTNRSITIDRTEFSAAIRIRWFDPVAGTYTLVSASSPNTTTQTITHPGNNAGGDADWLLVVDLA